MYEMMAFEKFLVMFFVSLSLDDLRRSITRNESDKSSSRFYLNRLIGRLLRFGTGS
jgi:hypothetical protein